MFRLNLSPVRSRHKTPASSTGPLKWVAFGSVFLVGFGLMAGWMLGHRGRSASDLEPDTGPVILAMQKIGQLHTTTYNMKDVLRQETESQPEGWLGSVPGMTAVAGWATHNEALVVAEGTVEAGIDLSGITEKDVTKVKAANGETKIHIHLPPVTIYPANVHVRVERNQPGLFWRDENIVPKAEEKARRRFRETAEKGNIQAKAQTAAIQTLEQMQKTLGFHNVEFSF